MVTELEALREADKHSCVEEETIDTVCVQPIQEPVAESEQQDSLQTQERRIVVVRRGETLATIAARHHTTVQRLRQLNGNKASRLRVGQRLRVR